MGRKFGLDDVTHIERIVVGPTRVDRLPSQDEINAQMDFVNRCLSEGRGQLVGTEKGVMVIQAGDQQLMVQHTVYHIGFRRPPIWLAHGRSAKGPGPSPLTGTLS
ncbi:hypothetical protein [Desulfoluna spongiiphila]|uniref:Uncharacterized protein n=1 Tax=Desulfoluna spongiiphila TaxID=419481 RepID=A0A1G5GSG0_9BACT|nr:hypothetical protein [Desulfoluna spongiiphila]SCY54483.1 hypothetical protein SAMN05216233_111106 [Desulfoluna spongiiphila]VVS92881.1 consensus disorder prediction [Desulfoluna spongiiphila]